MSADLKPFYSSFRRPVELRSASAVLFRRALPQLLQQLYALKTELSDPEIRVGIAIKMLHNTPKGSQFAPETLLPVLNDIEALMRDPVALDETGNRRARLSCLQQEYDLVQRYMDLDETLTLNTGIETIPTFPTISTLATIQADPEANLPRDQTEIDPDTAACLIM